MCTESTKNQKVHKPISDMNLDVCLQDLSSGVTLSSNQQYSRGPGSPGGGSNSSIGGLEEELVPRAASRMNQPARGSWVMVDPVSHAEGNEPVDGPPAVPVSPPWMVSCVFKVVKTSPWHSHSYLT